MADFAERVAASRGRRKLNGADVTAPDTEGIETMDETTTTQDQGLPPLDLTQAAADAPEPNRVAEVEAVFARLIAAEDRSRATRSAAELREEEHAAKARAVQIATETLRKCVVDRIVAESNGSEREVAIAKQAEEQAAIALTKAKTALSIADQESTALGDALADESVGGALQAAQAAVNGLLYEEIDTLAGRIGCELAHQLSKFGIELAQLLAIIGTSRVAVGQMDFDADLVRTLLGWAGITRTETLPGTQRLLDLRHYVNRHASLISDADLRVRGLNIEYEASRGATTIPPKWRPGEPLIVRNDRKGSVWMQFERRDQPVEIRHGQTLDLTEMGIPQIGSRAYLDDGTLEVVREA